MKKAEIKAECDRAAAERAVLDQLGEIISAKLERKVYILRDHTRTAFSASIRVEDLVEFLGIKNHTDQL